MKEVTILWADDEIDLLKPHIIFLTQKGYKIRTATNGNDALRILKEENFDIVFLDENMPGLTGIETLNKIKQINNNLPVIMITKSEEENIMEQAIGSKIADYLIKPVNPNQIILALKKHTEARRIVNEKVSTSYQINFNKLSQEINSASLFSDWVDIYKQLVFWELELDKTGSQEMGEILSMQKNQANTEFSKYIKKNYSSWFAANEKDKPLLSPNLFKNEVFPIVDSGEKVVFILIDNLRYDQWKIIEPIIGEYYFVENELMYSSILPSATQYARNAIFSGLMPLGISKMLPEYWLEDEEEGYKNEYEAQLFEKLLARSGKKYKFFYEKVFNNKAGFRISDSYRNLIQNDISIIVYNFIDMLSHARTDTQMIRELAEDDGAYRSITQSWFSRSPLLELLKNLSKENIKVVITTDHGTIRVQNPVKIIGDRNTSTNLRYKNGKSLNYPEKEVFEIVNPESVHLPRTHPSTRFIFALNSDYMVYQNNYGQFVNYYKNTFQHGGVSMEELIIPLVKLTPKK